MIDELLRALPTVAQSPFAFVGYAFVVFAWMFSIFQLGRLRVIAKHLKDLPERDRLKALRLDYKENPKEGLSAEQYIRLQRMKFWLIGFIVTLAAIIILVVVTLSIIKSDSGISELIKIDQMVFSDVEFSGDIDIYMFVTEENNQQFFFDILYTDNVTQRWRLKDENNVVIFDRDMSEDPGIYTLSNIGEYSIEVGGGRATGKYGFVISHISDETVTPTQTTLVATENPLITATLPTLTLEPTPTNLSGLEKICTVNRDNVYLRAGPGLQYDEIGIGSINSNFIPNGRDENFTWIFGEYKGSIVWISEPFLSCDFDVTSLQILSEITPEPFSSPTYTSTPQPPVVTVPPAPSPSTTPSITPSSTLAPTETATATNTVTVTPVSGNVSLLASLEPNTSSGEAFDGNLSTFWVLGHQFTLIMSWSDDVSVDRIIIWDRPQDSPDNNQINTLRLTLSDGQTKLFDMNSQGSRCIDVIFSSTVSINSLTVHAEDASGGNGLSEVEIWSGSKTTGLGCGNSGVFP